MVKSNKTPLHNQQSEKFRAKPLKGPIEIVDYGDVNYVQIANDNKHARENSTSKSPEIMSTSELISTVRQIWDRASRSLAHSQPKPAFDFSTNVGQKYNHPRILVGNDRFGITNLVERDYLQVDLNSSSYFSCIVQQSLKFIRATRRIHHVPCNYQFIERLFRESGEDGSIKHDILLEEENCVNVENPYRLTDRYGLMRREIPYLKDLCFGGNNRINFPIKALYSDSLFHGNQNLGFHRYSHARTSAQDCINESNQSNMEANHLSENGRGQCENLNTRDELQSGTRSSDSSKVHPLVNQEHAVSGALAGVFVSLCLHPIDTIKTIVQSCQPGKKSICYIGQSVISERGIPGLYRGISSNITTSAPISAIYTFTYESVKEFLLPSLAKEYHSVAHCSAGACASIATSFVFTPSERIKQQMQVNSTYQNCWNAVQRIIEVGGLRSLYAGWVAVLCRNIPHSIIKFYTYESLKPMFVSSQPPTKQPNTLQTLLCGGVAGSTAALFSTPFDVVKTRLQTQMPGSRRRYNSILYAFEDICKHEGFKGLYRGLIPRLAMYMSQGALFFASYEFFKSLLSLNAHQRKSEILQHDQNSNDDPILS